MADTYVLDSFAVLALLRQEKGHEAVADVLRRTHAGEARTFMTWVNVGEVAYIVERRWGAGHLYRVLGTLEATKIEFVPAGRDLALAAAHIKAEHPLAYADAFAAALAMLENATLVTGDPEFKPIEHALPILWLAQ